MTAEEKFLDLPLEEVIGDRFGRYSKYIIQDRALPGRRVQQLRSDRHRRRGCDQLPQHWPEREHQLQLPRAGDQRRRRLGLLKHRQRDDAGRRYCSGGAA